MTPTTTTSLPDHLAEVAARVRAARELTGPRSARLASAEDRLAGANRILTVAAVHAAAAVELAELRQEAEQWR